ncbi:hypothetical protein ACTXT7_011631 [Hymenolepis weldensis]
MCGKIAPPGYSIMDDMKAYERDHYDEQNRVPMSDSRVSEKPSVAKMRPRTLIIAEVFVDGMDITSGHLEYQPTNTKQTTPLIGLVKSSCTLLHGVFFGNRSIGLSHGGILAAFWYLRQPLTSSSMSLSIPGQYVYPLTNLSIRLIPD